MSGPGRSGGGGAERQAPPRLVFERELLYGEAVEIVAEVMEDHGISQSELARRLGRTPARVNHLLNGRENITLRTLADLGHALGLRFELAPIPFVDRSGTPASKDPPPPESLSKRRRRVAETTGAEAPEL